MVGAGVGFTAGLFVILGYILSRLRASRALVAIIALAACLRFGAVFIDGYIAGLIGLRGDAAAYEATIWYVATQWQSSVIHAPLTTTSAPGVDGPKSMLFSAIFAPIYLVFGRDPTLLRLFMAFFGVLTVLNVVLLGKSLHDTSAGLVAGLIIAVFPYWVYLSIILYRDMLLVWLLSSLLVIVSRWQRESNNRTPVALAGMVILGGAVVSMRIENFVVLAALAGGVVYATYADRLSRTAVGVGAATTFVIGHVSIGNQVITRLAQRRIHLSRPRPGAYLSGVSYDSPLGLVAFIPIGAAYFLLVPFPWQIVGTEGLLAVIQNVLLWYPLLGLSLVGMWQMWQTPEGRRQLVPLLIFVIVGVIGYGLVSGNIGPAMRHRTQFQVVFVALAAVAIANFLEEHSISQMVERSSRIQRMVRRSETPRPR